MNLTLFRLVFAGRAVPQRIIRLLVRRPVLVRLDGFAMFVRLDDFAVGLGIALRRHYEKYLTARMRPYLTAGSVFLDVGANIGYYSLLAAANVRPGGKVIAFEPYEPNLALLRASMEQNGFDHIEIHNRAACDREGFISFVFADSNGQVSLTADPGHPMRVPAVRLDDALAKEARIDVVKIDVEGAEALVIAGMPDLLRRHGPVVFFEFTPASLRKISGVEPGDLLDSLRRLGYELSVVDATPRHSPVSNEAIMQRFSASKSDHLDLQAVMKIGGGGGN